MPPDPKRNPPASVFAASRKLPQKPHVILEIQLQIVDVVFQLRQPLDAQAEGESCIALGVILHEAVDRGIDHPSAEKFDPAGLLAHVAALAAAEYARRVNLHRWFGKRKIARSQARF